MLAGVVGHPIEHTLSPSMHNAVYRELGLDWVYIPLPLADEADLMRFLGAARVLPFVGFNVTMPFKQIMLSMCDEVAMMATMAGAVNAVHCVDGKFVGYNTDGRGLVEALADEASFDPKGKRVAIVGAGGAAGAALVSFVVAKAASVIVTARSLDSAEEVIARVESHARATELGAIELSHAEGAVSSADLVINATPLGMKAGDPSPVPSAWLNSGQTVFDMVYGGPTTALVNQAREVGATALDGLGMLVAQGAISVDIWSESAQISAPRPVMRAAAEEQLRAIRASEMRGIS
jgi:shikimate dehydrogenase